MTAHAYDRMRRIALVLAEELAHASDDPEALAARIAERAHYGHPWPDECRSAAGLIRGAFEFKRREDTIGHGPAMEEALADEDGEERLAA